MSRRIVQFQALQPVRKSVDGQAFSHALYVLCNDGSMWWWNLDHWEPWGAEIPQDEEPRRLGVGSVLAEGRVR